MVSHSLGVLERIIMIPEGKTEWPDLVPDTYESATYSSDWARLATEVETIWADDSQLGKMQVLPPATELAPEKSVMAGFSGVSSGNGKYL